MKTRRGFFYGFLLVLSLALSPVWSQNGPNDTTWIHLWDGDNLSDWDLKIQGRQLNDNWQNTFRSSGGNLEINYSDYNNNFAFGHAAYKIRPFSFYFIKAEYQHYGNQTGGNPGSWALENNGLMLHSQSMASMGLNQDFPVSMEAQLLGSGNTGADNNSTMNLCTPGTAFYNNATGGSPNTAHCVSASNNTRPGSGEWAWVSALMLGDSIIHHYVGNSTQPTFTYYRPVQWNGAVSGATISINNGTPITEGYVSIQSESHPFRFRVIDVVDLVGCMTPGDQNYKSYLVRHDDAQCAGPVGVTVRTSVGFATQAANSSLTIETPDRGVYHVAVFDINGAEVYSQILKGASLHTLDQTFKPGLYVYQVSYPEGTFKGKVLVP